MLKIIVLDPAVALTAYVNKQHPYAKRGATSRAVATCVSSFLRHISTRDFCLRLRVVRSHIYIPLNG